jgi:lysyl-tRNA synthetase class 1
MIGYAIAYYRDFVKPQKRYRAPNATERAALEDLLAALERPDTPSDAEALQNEVYEIGKRHGFANLRDWFKALYEVLLGQETGPRMGSFIALYGIEETKSLIRKVLAGESLAA